MVFSIENGIMVTDLDAQSHNLKNVTALSPLPAGIASSTDPRLSDARTPLAGSVVDSSVATTAAIQQSKLALTGSIPTPWLGTTATTAAQGNLAEYVANKGVAGGYASLDGTGKLPSAQLPATAGAGTVTSVALTLPSHFAVTGSPITASGTLTAAWNSVAAGSWFGNPSGAAAAPSFQATPLPVATIPSLDASKITTGIIATARLPASVGLGASSASGLVPNPGPTGGGALATDYLARDMSYKAIPVLPASYQPTLATPALSSPTGGLTGPQSVIASSASVITSGSITYFYSLSSSGGSSTGPFAEYPSSGSVSVPPLQTVWVYVAKAGWTNSAIASYTNPNTS